MAEANKQPIIQQLDSVFSSSSETTFHKVTEIFAKNNVKHEIPAQTLKNISKKSYEVWKAQNQQKDINKLVLIQLYESLGQKIKTSTNIAEAINKCNQKLAKINATKVDEDKVKKVSEVKTDEHFYIAYSNLLVNKKDEIKIKQQMKAQSGNNEKNVAQSKAKAQEKVQQKSKPQQKSSQIKSQQKAEQKKPESKPKQQVKREKPESRPKEQQTAKVEKPQSKPKQQTNKAETKDKTDNQQKVSQSNPPKQKKIQQKEQGTTKSQLKTEEKINKEATVKAQPKKEPSEVKENQQVKPEKVVVTQESDKKPQNLDKDRAKDILNKFLTTNEINGEDLQFFNKFCQYEATPSSLKAFKEQYREKAIDQQGKSALKSYMQWVTLKKREANKETIIKQQQPQVTIQQANKQGAKDNQQANKQIKQAELKLQQSPQNQSSYINKAHSTQFYNLMKKYFDQPNLKVKMTNPNAFNLKLSFANSAIENPHSFNIKMYFGAKQTKQVFSQLKQRRIVGENKQEQITLIEIFTKKAEEIEENIEQKLKNKSLKLDTGNFRTLTEPDRICLIHKQQPRQQASLYQKLQDLVTQQRGQNNCKLELRTTVGLGERGKQKPENRKLVKCLLRGFDFGISVSGSAVVNFRKNLELNSKDSAFFPFFSLIKNSQIKLNIKKVQDMNNLLTKLGILTATNNTPTVREVLLDICLTLFNTQRLSAHEIVTQCLGEFQTTKVSISKIWGNSLVKLSVEGARVNHVFEKL